jgi:hypothetical protein
LSKNSALKTRFKKLPLDEQYEMFMGKCRTKKEMQNWIRLFLGLDIPYETVSRYADTNPLDAIWEIYNICVNRDNPEKIQELLYVASRGSGKTLGTAIAETMVIFHDKRDVAHVGAILSQASRCYDYQKKFFLNDMIKPILHEYRPNGDKIIEQMNMKKSTFTIDKQQVSLEVIPCTLQACNTLDAIVLLKEEDNEIQKEIKDVKVGDFINTPLGYKEVIKEKEKEAECFEVELDDGRIIRATTDHKIWTNKGWVELKDLTESHDIL